MLGAALLLDALAVTKPAEPLYVGELEERAPVLARFCKGCGCWFLTRAVVKRCYLCRHGLFGR